MKTCSMWLTRGVPSTSLFSGVEGITTNLFIWWLNETLIAKMRYEQRGPLIGNPDTVIHCRILKSSVKKRQYCNAVNIFAEYRIEISKIPSLSKISNTVIPWKKSKEYRNTVRKKRQYRKPIRGPSKKV